MAAVPSATYLQRMHRSATGSNFNWQLALIGRKVLMARFLSWELPRLAALPVNICFQRELQHELRRPGSARAALLLMSFGLRSPQPFEAIFCTCVNNPSVSESLELWLHARG